MTAMITAIMDRWMSDWRMLDRAILTASVNCMTLLAIKTRTGTSRQTGSSHNIMRIQRFNQDRVNEPNGAY